MTILALFFYLFAAIAVASAIMVIFARNPVHSVLFLILTFVNAAALFLLVGAEFLAAILIVVYVGAVAVLFLFVVMMLDIDVSKMREGVQVYLPIGSVIGIVLLVELIMVFTTWQFAPDALSAVTAPVKAAGNVTNTEALGLLLYTRFIYFFQAAGLVLLVAMVGAIVLTLRHKPHVRRQSIPEQVGRTPATAIEIKDVKPGQGL
jgi:NADH-quinone oxidoreductase subunit J